MPTPLLAEIPLSERPRERCLEKGAHALSLRECLALILHSGPPGLGSMGLASAILDRPGKGLSEEDRERAFFTAMEVSADAHLAGHSGMGEAAQARLQAAFELGRRYALFRSLRNGHRPKPRQTMGVRALRTEAAHRIPASFRQSPEEWLGFVPLYRSGELGRFCLVERGVRTHVNVEPAELFARILALRPAAFFLFHNHPSSDPTPSEPDFDLTREVGGLARKLGIQLLDHGIVLPNDLACEPDVSWIGVL